MDGIAVAHEVRPGPAGSPVVLLANSLGATRSMWDRQLDDLTDFFTVVRYDARGHGTSPAPAGPYTIDDLAADVVTLLDHLGIDEVHLVGLSLGGMTALRTAAICPERIASLTVLCTAALLGPRTAWLDRAAVVRQNGTAAVAAAVVRRWYSPCYYAQHPCVVEWAEAMVSATDPEGYAACCEAIAAMDLRADLARISAPTLAIAGELDPATPPTLLEAIAAGVRNGRSLVVPGAAHLANHEAPEFVNTAIIDHIRFRGRVTGPYRERRVDW